MSKTTDEIMHELGMGDDTSPVLTQDAKAELQEQSFQTDQVLDLMRKDMNFLAGLLMPTVFEFFFPPVFRALWSWLQEFLNKEGRFFPQVALGLPRGFAKTTVMKLLIVYIILFTKKRFILVVSETERKACNIIADVITMLENSNIVKLFGDWKLGAELDRQDLKKFGFRGRNIILLGIGVGGSLRGYNLDNARPDFMLFDDIQSRECADSQVESEKLENWFFGTALKAKNPKGCMYLFVANMYPTPHSLLRKLKKNKTWTKFIAGGILSDGTSLWPELFPLDQLLDEFLRDLEAGKPEIFYSEVMNDEDANMNNAIDLTKVPNRDFEHEFNAGSFIIIDPSNDKANSDNVAITRFDCIDGYPVAREIIDGKLSPGDTIRSALSAALRCGASLILVESNAYQYSLLYWFEQVTVQLGITGITCLPIYSGGVSKNSRILTMFKQLMAGEILLDPSIRSKVFHQVSSFKPLRRDNTDNILDCLSYAPRAMSEFGQYITINNQLEREDYEQASSFNYTDVDNCPF